MQAATLSAKQYSQALRGLPAQLTDIVTQLASGQSVFQIAIQQGGQIRDIFGGFGNAMRGIASVLTPVRVAVGGALGITTALATAFNEAERESFALSKSIILSGNAAGVTRDRLYELAEGIDDLVGTQASAAATLAQLISTGRIAANNLAEFATVAQQLQRTAAQPVEETVKIFAELGRRPVEAALALNRQVNFLTVDIYKQIKALEDQGRVSEAAEIAQRAYASAASERVQRLDQELGTLQRLSRGAGEVFKSMWDSVLNIGRPASISEQIADIESDIARLQREAERFDVPGASGVIAARRQAAIDELQKRVGALRAVQSAEEDAAAAEAERAKALTAHVEAEREALKVTQARRAAFEDTTRQRLTFDVSGIRQSLDAALSGFHAYAAQLEVLRSADLVSETDFYAAKRALVDRDSAARISALQAERTRVGAEIQRLIEARKVAGSDAKTESERIAATRPFDRDIAESSGRVAELESEIAQRRRESSAELARLSLDETHAAGVSIRALQDARTAAEAYLETLRKQNERRLESFGLGERAREIAGARNTVDDRFAGQRLALDRDRQNRRITEEQYGERLAIIREFNQSAIEETDHYYTELEKRQGSFALGAREAFANYLDSTRNVAALTKEAFQNPIPASNAFRATTNPRSSTRMRQCYPQL